MFANRLVELDLPLHQLCRDEEIDEIASRIVAGGRQFHDNVLNGCSEAGIDIANPFEMLLAIPPHRIKAVGRALGPGKPETPRLRAPCRRAIASIEQIEKGRRGSVAGCKPKAGPP